MKVLAILSDAWDPPGAYLEAGAAMHGVAIDARVPPGGDELPPDERAHLGLIVMGGPQSACALDEHPHLGPTGELIRRFHAAGKPVLGICLGAQLIAGALGGRCYRGPAPERGFQPVYATAEATDDPLLPPIPAAGLRLLEFHNDSFELPADAVRLMRGETYRNQAFRIGATTYGFQPHIEATPEGLGAWLKDGPGIAYRERAPELWREILDAADLCATNHEPLARVIAERWFARASRCPDPGAR